MGVRRLFLAFSLVSGLAAPFAAPCSGPVILNPVQTQPLLSDSDAAQRPGVPAVKRIPAHDSDEPGGAPMTPDAAASPVAAHASADGETFVSGSKARAPAMSPMHDGRQPMGALPADHDRSGSHAAVPDAVVQTESERGIDAGAHPADVGLKVRALSDAERHDLGIAEGGLRVTGVTDGSAQHAGFRPGDVVLMLDGIAVSSPTQFRKLMYQLPHDRPVPVLVRRPDSNLFLPLDAPGR